MKKESIYKNLAKYYDLLYSGKDYKKETDQILKLIKKYKKSKGNNLLEIACGTGKHANYLKKDFVVTATDINMSMLSVAKKNTKGVTFKKLDMVNFNLKKKFDSIICLFSSIGYVKTYPNLKKAIDNFSQHLVQGGVVLIEGWYTQDAYKDGYPSMLTYETPDLKISRLCVSKSQGMISITDMHILIAEKDKDVRYLLDKHQLAMFEPKKIIQYMETSGLKTIPVMSGLIKGRILYIGIKQ